MYVVVIVVVYVLVVVVCVLHVLSSVVKRCFVTNTYMTNIFGLLMKLSIYLPLIKTRSYPK